MKTMTTTTLAAAALLLSSTLLAEAQLNFDGDPLTEDAEYTAEESRHSERSSRRSQRLRPFNATGDAADSYLAAAENLRTEQKAYPVYAKEADNTLRNDLRAAADEFKGDPQVLFVTPQPDSATSLPLEAQLRGNALESPVPFDLALNTFLNSKTPEESSMALEYYLRGRQQQPPSPVSPVDQQPRTANIVLPRQPSSFPSSADQRSRAANVVLPHAYPPTTQQDYGNHGDQSNGFRFDPLAPQTRGPYDSALQSQDSYQTSNSLGPPAPPSPAIQPRNDFRYPPGRRAPPYSRPPLRRRVGKPFGPQSRIGVPDGGRIYVGAAPPTFPGKGPVEVIYTRPPGFGHRRPSHLAGPSDVYASAGAWFPDADHRPPDNDVYYSQLYAQSYDPNYYNYIAKTGKIKPHLYGKLEKHDDGILAELMRGFKNHGLRKMLTPSFLLGMTIPVLTLMLSALVHKRSLGRSDSGDIATEERIREYLERWRKAVECHGEERGDGEC